MIEKKYSATFDEIMTWGFISKHFQTMTNKLFDYVWWESFEFIHWLKERKKKKTKEKTYSNSLMVWNWTKAILYIVHVLKKKIHRKNHN